MFRTTPSPPCQSNRVLPPTSIVDPMSPIANETSANNQTEEGNATAMVAKPKPVTPKPNSRCPSPWS